MKRKLLVYLMVLVVIMTSFSGCKSKKETESDLSMVSEYIISTEIIESSSTVESDNSSAESTVSSDNAQSSTGSSADASEAASGSSDTGVEDTDRAASYKNAYLIAPIASKFDSEANKIRNSVLSAKDSVSVSGTVWYISNNGNDSNSGNSKSQAWATTNALKKYQDKIKSGDAVLFERGSVFRGGFTAVSGVYYGAYGSGDKPCIYGSQKAGNGKWSNKGGNIWCFDSGYFTSNTVGGIIFDHGEAVGDRKTSTSELKEEYDFTEYNSKVYVYMSKNPTELFDSIEIAVDGHLISVPSGVSNVTFDNLTLKYCGGHGIRTNNGTSNITIKNCEIAWMGGSILAGYGDGDTRYGNGIEFWQGIDTATVINCWIYQIYDSGVTHQGTDAYVAKNIKISGCLIEYCGFGSIEYWHNQSAYNSMENIEYSSNVMRFSGFGYGGGRLGIGYHIHSNGDTNDNKATNFVIKNNIFDLSFRMLLDIRGGSNTMPTMSGNTYSQYDGRYLGCYGSDILNASFNSDIDSTIRSFDSSAVIVHNSASN